MSHHKSNVGWMFSVVLLAGLLPLFTASWSVASAGTGIGDGAIGLRHFYLKNGDRVVFYGDSITEQRFYTTDVELYVRTRFPDLHVRFVNSGVGGDAVGGGWAGPVNLRLKRDVFSFKPNVVTIMLGMNDGRVQAFNQGIFDKYKNGYIHIIKSIKSHLPDARIVLIAPSPFDDVTSPPQFPGGYNAVLIRYGQFVKKLAAKYDLGYANFNRPLVKVLQQAKKINPQLAKQIIPQRVHPDANGQLVMAEALLKAWNAPAMVTAVDIHANTKLGVQSANTAVSALARTKGVISWTQMDQALPMPIMDLHENWPQFPRILAKVGAPYNEVFSRSLWEAPAPNWKFTNPVTALVVKLCGFYHNLDSEMLRVQGLSAPRYTLKIDGHWVGVFSRQQLAAGVNLARYNTPMMAQAYQVLHQIWHEAQVRFYIWRFVQLPLEKNRFNHGVWRWSFVGLPMGKSKRQAELAQSLIGQLYKNLFKTVASRAYQIAKPKPHQYTLSPVTAAG